MDEDGDEIDLKEGMGVSNEDGDELGTLSALLIEEEEEEAEFLILKTATGERLVPFDAVLGVGDGSLILDVPKDVLERYPVVKAGAEPSDDDIDRAHELYEETASYTDDDEE